MTPYKDPDKRRLCWKLSQQKHRKQIKEKGRNFGQPSEQGQGIPDVECVNSTVAKAPDQTRNQP